MLIVDDSAVARHMIARTIEGVEGFVVAGAVPTVATALAHLRRERVDIVLLDIELPGTDGLSGLPDLLDVAEGARVLIVSSSCGEGAVASLQALSLGAADTLAKPGAAAMAGQFATQLGERLVRLRDAERRGDALPAWGPQPPPEFDIVAIGASTGGVHALAELFRAMPATMTLPILVTQHLPGSFTDYFAAQIATLADRPCDIAVDRLRVRPGRVILAPGDAHIRCVAAGDGAAIRLSREPVASGCMPSVDPMFASIAQLYGSRAMGVILSGMGRDGCVGAGAIAAAGGMVVAQDQASSVVWGMPGAVAGIADAILPPNRIGGLIGRGRRRP